ncbi:methionine adenosyltransferase [Candidatus Micrarchaeota archaeon]|nr:methionine adenosyltransferase [Candidatus Micrarchaeota archaeon]
MRNINIEQLGPIPIEERAVELVERKGAGHPDTLIDGVMESVSRNLCKAYLNEFGKIMHHNVDKGLICGGGTRVEYGGGKFVKPIFVLLSGRATSEVDGKVVPALEIAVDSAKKYLKERTRFLNVDDDVLFDTRISQGSRDLVDLFLRAPPVPLANDTSFGVGFAPFSETERIVLETEKLLNSKDYKAKFPAVGEDVKVMGVRNSDKINLTVCIAFVSRHVSDLNDYIKQKEAIAADILSKAKTLTSREVEVAINTADDYKRDSVYLTVTGLSMEMGDDGSVGRGNRSNGLITPMRPMTLEAAAGKNPVNHVGKIYSALANQIASDIVKCYPQVAEVNVSLLSQIGKPIDQPKMASVQLITKKGESLEPIKSKVEALVDGWLEDAPAITQKIIDEEVGVYY